MREDSLLAIEARAKRGETQCAEGSDAQTVCECDVGDLTAEVRRLRAQLDAIDSISEEAWEDGTAVDWIAKIRSGHDLTGLPTQEEYEDRAFDFVASS